LIKRLKIRGMKCDVLSRILSRRVPRGDCLTCALVQNEKAFLPGPELWSVVPHHVTARGQTNFGRFASVISRMHLIDLNLSEAPVGIMLANRPVRVSIGAVGRPGRNQVGRHADANYPS